MFLEMMIQPIEKIMLAPYTSYEKSHTGQGKKIINNCSTCRPLHLRPIAQNINPCRLQPNKLWQINITNCPKLSPSAFLHVSIDNKFFFYMGHTSPR